MSRNLPPASSALDGLESHLQNRAKERRACTLPIDSVAISINRNVEADYQSRSVFPTLRRTKDQMIGPSSVVHWCSPDLAAAVREDAIKRRVEVSGSLMAAYSRMLSPVDTAIKIAQARKDWLAGNEPKVLSDRWDTRHVTVVPHQFQAIDLPADLKLPGDVDGPSKCASYSDRHGRLCRVKRDFGYWPNAYQVSISFTKAERAERLAKAAAKKQSNPCQPSHSNADEYRRDAVNWFSAFAKGSVPKLNLSSSYEYDPAVLRAVMQKVQEAEALLLTGRIQARSVAIKPTAEPKASRTVLRLVHGGSGASS